MKFPHCDYPAFVLVALMGKLTVQLITRLSGLVPRPSTLSGFLNGTSGGVEHVCEDSEGSEFPTLLVAMTLNV